MSRLSVVGFFVLVSIFVVSAVARAGVGELIEVHMEGAINQVPPDPMIEMHFTVGQPTSLTYVYDTAVPDGDENPGQGRYDAITSLSGSFGSYAFSSLGGSISVEVPGNLDRHVFQVSVQSIGGADPIGDAVGVFELTGIFSNLEDPTGTAFADDSLPTDLDLMDFEFADARLRFDDGNSAVFVRSNVNLLTVPEPGGTAGLAAAAGALVLLRRRRSQMRLGRLAEAKLSFDRVQQLNPRYPNPPLLGCSDVYFGRQHAVLTERSKIKRKTMERRKREYLANKAA